jgi:hypothetical protein
MSAVAPVMLLGTHELVAAILALGLVQSVASTAAHNKDHSVDDPVVWKRCSARL